MTSTCAVGWPHMLPEGRPPARGAERAVLPERHGHVPSVTCEAHVAAVRAVGGHDETVTVSSPRREPGTRGPESREPVGRHRGPGPLRRLRRPARTGPCSCSCTDSAARCSTGRRSRPPSRETCRVMAIDLVGFGRTQPLGRSPHIDANRDLLARFVDEVVGHPVILVGNSMGGLTQPAPRRRAARPRGRAGARRSRCARGPDGTPRPARHPHVRRVCRAGRRPRAHVSPPQPPVRRGAGHGGAAALLRRHDAGAGARPAAAPRARPRA